ncbi:MAG: helix-turn-helix domain-containing protein [Vampirovibrionales bacterium]|jgi:transcriptional regulator with XRE-family HTH domain
MTTKKNNDLVPYHETAEFKTWEANRTLGIMMRAWREGQGLTLEEVAEKVGLTRQQIWVYENDKRTPSIKRTIELASALDAPVRSWLQYRIETEMKKHGFDIEIAHIEPQAVETESKRAS